MMPPIRWKKISAIALGVYLSLWVQSCGMDNKPDPDVQVLLRLR